MFKVLDPICEPKRATKYSACVDLFSAEDVIIGAGETKIVPLGVKIDLGGLYHSWYFYTEQNCIEGSWEDYLKSHYLALFVRSSLAVKGLIIPNGQGVIDLDYPDEIGLILHCPMDIYTVYSLQDNSNPSFMEIKKGDKVAQAMLMEHKSYLMGYESDVVRNGGYGSTGK